LNLVIQSFGSESEYRRALLTVISFYAHAKTSVAAPTFLFTDSPGYFDGYLQGLPVTFFELTSEKIRTMRGHLDFLHRMKIAIIEESFLACGGNILYADSDTFFYSDPFALLNMVSARTSFMHLKEYRFESLTNMKLPAGAPFHAFVKCISEHEFSMPDGSRIKVNLDQYSWNAGVMMLDRTVLGLLPYVFALTDYFFKETQNHASEQYAFSVILQNHTDLHSCDQVVYHYWYRVKKKIVDDILKREFGPDFEKMNLEKKMASVMDLTKELPHILDEHIFTLRDKAIQAFCEDKFGDGFRFSIKALAKDPMDKVFLMDFGYHVRRWINNVLHPGR